MGEGPYPTPPESYLRSKPLLIIEAAERYREDVGDRKRERAAVVTVNGQNGHHPGLSGSSKSNRTRLTPPLTCKPFPPAPLDISSLNLQCEQHYSSPNCTAPRRPQSPAGYPVADPFVSSGPSSQNERPIICPAPYSSSHGYRYSAAQEDDEEFETRFATIQCAYEPTAATN